MYKKLFHSLSGIFFALHTGYATAADSYRFLHVSIDTPWMIFIFLLVIILFPFVLMAILYWYFAFKKDPKGNGDKQAESSSAIDGD